MIPWTVPHQGFSVHGSLQARILGWVAIPFSRDLPNPGIKLRVSYIAGRFFSVWVTRVGSRGRGRIITLHQAAWTLSLLHVKAECYYIFVHSVSVDPRFTPAWGHDLCCTALLPHCFTGLKGWKRKGRRLEEKTKGKFERGLFGLGFLNENLWVEWGETLWEQGQGHMKEGENECARGTEGEGAKGWKCG